VCPAGESTSYGNVFSGRKPEHAQSVSTSRGEALGVGWAAGSMAEAQATICLLCYLQHCSQKPLAFLDYAAG